MASVKQIKRKTQMKAIIHTKYGPPDELHRLIDSALKAHPPLAESTFLHLE
jgi:hypothetical protein